MNRFLNVPQPHATCDGQAHFGNHLASVFTDDRRRDDFVGSFFTVNLTETSVFALGLSAIVVFDRQFVSVKVRLLFFDFRIRRSGMSDFGIGVGYPTHDTVFCVEPVRPWHQGVERCVFGLGSPHLGPAR